MKASAGFARAVVRRRGAIAFLWLLGCGALLPLALGVEEKLDVSARIEGSESAAVEQALHTRFEAPFAKTALLVLTGLPAPDTEEGSAVLRGVVAALEVTPHVSRTFSYLDTRDALFLGPSATFVVVGLDPGELPVDALIPPLRTATEPAAARLRQRFPKAALKWTGEPVLNFDIRRASTQEVRRAERRALPVTLALLLLAFGALVAALLPIVAGGAAIVLTLGAAMLLTLVMPVAVTLESVVSMLGLGLGIDYALLTVSRFRESLRAGQSAEAAAQDAVRHAGSTVALSGAAVAIGFLGLLAVPLLEIRSIAIGGLIVVAASVLLATTLLPGLLAWLGPRIEAGRWKAAAAPAPGERWRRWGAFVAEKPLLVLILAGGPTLLLAFEARRLDTGMPNGDWLPPAMESTAALHELQAMGRSGLVQEIRVMLELPEQVSGLSAGGWAATGRLEQRIASDPRIAQVRSLRSFAGERADELASMGLLPELLKQSYLSRQEDVALLNVIPREHIAPGELCRFVRELRRDAAGWTGLHGARVRVGGVPAFNADYEDVVAGRFGSTVALVVSGTLLALFLGFRSVLIPIKAVALNLLSVAASFGAVVLVFQDGLGGSWLGLAGASGSVFPAVPILVFCIVFGLSIDYEVFLISRVAEARRAGMSDADGVAEGLARTGGVITSAAAIMVAVFGAFAAGELLLIKMLGFALAVAVALDATVIRVAVGPALLCLAGRWNWWPGGVAAIRGDAPRAACFARSRS